MTVYELLERRARDRGDQPFLVGYDRTSSASELLAASDEWGDRFATAGVKARDRVLLKLPNSPEFLAIWFGLIREGAVMVPINPASPPAEVGWLAENSDARLMVDPEGVKECAEPKGTVALPDDTAAVLYTSGSTGKPKGCMLSHDYYEIAGRVWVEAMELSAEDRLLMMLPLFHMNPQVTSVYGALLSGATIVWVERFSRSRFWSQVDSLRPSQAFLIGAIPVLLARQQEGKRHVCLHGTACICHMIPFRRSAAANQARCHGAPALVVRRWDPTSGARSSLITPIFRGKKLLQSALMRLKPILQALLDRR